jgi:acetyltransferase-like isoleucine patch superfamily enzyme
MGLRTWIGDAVLRLSEQARLREQEHILARCAAIGSRVRLRQPVVIYQPESLSLGSDVDIGEFSHLRASGGLTIGNRVLLAAHVVITTRGHSIQPPRFGVTEDAPVRIEDDVWIGAGAIVLSGVTIGRGSVVAAGAVVTHDVEPMTVVAGVPAKQIRRIETPHDQHS